MRNAQRNKTVLAMAGLVLAALAPSAVAQSDRARVGDLVEYVSGMGPTLAEIVVGPDSSGYVVLLLPTGKQVPVNTQKLRLIQRAGTPNAPLKVGEPVSWVDGHVKESGSVVKVNGNWCQVKTPSATTIGWVECKELLGAAQAATKKDKPAPTSNAASEKPSAVKLSGNWENADGTVKLEFQSASKCYISFGPMTGPCTYNQNAKGVTVTFAGEDLALAANDDGSLSSVNPDAMMPIRLKKK